MQRWAVAFALVGLAGQVTQILFVRLRFPLCGKRLLPQVMVEERVPDPAFRFGQLQTAMAAADAVTPPMGIEQGNPHSRMRNVVLLYAGRQMAAADDGCNAPFGGDPRQCLPMSESLVQLFGGTGFRYQGTPNIFAQPVPFQAAAVTPANFERLCSAYKLDTVVASYVDPVWWDRSSWVWQLAPRYANNTARVFSCPQPEHPAAAISQSGGTSYTGS